MHNLDLILTLTGGLVAAMLFGYLTQRAGLSPIIWLCLQVVRPVSGKEAGLFQTTFQDKRSGFNAACLAATGLKRRLSSTRIST